MFVICDSSSVQLVVFTDVEPNARGFLMFAYSQWPQRLQPRSGPLGIAVRPLPPYRMRVRLTCPPSFARPTPEPPRTASLDSDRPRRTCDVISTLLLLAVFSLAADAPGAADTSKPDPAAIEFFESKVRPVLANHCLGCHGPEKQKAGLRLDSRPAMIEDGDSGPAVRPGDPQGSRLVEVIRYEADIQMPPKRKLSDAEIAAVTEWVRSGAHWPDAVKSRAPSESSASSRRTVSAEDRAFWAFQPVKAVQPPDVREQTHARSAIDRFVLAKLEEKNLRPVGQADKRTLIRRATFDITGLPPTPEEIDAFLADDSTDAFERVVDRLLASPHYGERWGRHWLDVARYAEDQAHTFEARLYPFGYRYRDWVVKALNDDMPFDRFIREQLAGDLLDGPDRDERLAATGLFALGPVYYGKAVYDELDDRVDTLSRGLLGLTVACARCHDHKFDPISQGDYYALAGIFAGTKYKEYPKAPEEVLARYEKGQAEIKAKTAEIAAFLREQSARWSEAAAGQSAKYILAAWTLSNRRRAEPKLSASEIAKPDGLDAAIVDRWVKYLFSDNAKQRPHLKRWIELLASQDAATDLSRDASAHAAVTEVANGFQAYLVATLKLRDALKQYGDAATLTGQAGTKYPSLASADVDLIREVVSVDGLFALEKNEVEGKLADDPKQTLKSKRAELDRLKKGAPPKPPVIHALAEGPAPANMKIFLRGNPSTPGEEAPRRFLEVLSAEESKPFTAGSGRLELAKAIASPDNPLTSRVIVNRIWAQHFGRGIVSTPSNFGHLGEQPSHPELLDYLVGRFIASGWSFKALHREIMLSSAYQRSCETEPTDRAADPENVYLWRANRRRLEVESWRDAMLAVTGELDRSVGGPSTELKANENHRRTLYASISRHNLDGLLRLFDFPDPNLTSDKRTVTTVPLQQLFVLNSPFMEHRAKALAARLTTDPTEPDDTRIRRAFVLLFGRPPRDGEVTMALAFLTPTDKAPEKGQSPPRWEQLAQVLLATNEFSYVD